MAIAVKLAIASAMGTNYFDDGSDDDRNACVDDDDGESGVVAKLQQ